MITKSVEGCCCSEFPFLLHKKKWKGINIDTSQFSIDLFNYMRPNDLNYNCILLI